MTQTVTTISSYSVTPTNPAGQLTRTVDNAIVTSGWSTPIAVTDASTFTTVAGTGGSISVQFSSDSVDWVVAAAFPYVGTFTGGVPPNALWIRAQGIRVTGALITDVPIPWVTLTAAQIDAVVASPFLYASLITVEVPGAFDNYITV